MPPATSLSTFSNIRRMNGTQSHSCSFHGKRKLSVPSLASRVLLPKLSKRRPPVLDEEKLRMLFERARSTRLYPFIVMAAATGCRRGELLALTWPDLDFTTGVLLVSKSLEQTRIGGLRVKTPNCDESRELGVPEWALEVLSSTGWSSSVTERCSDRTTRPTI
jgi:integrase